MLGISNTTSATISATSLIYRLLINQNADRSFGSEAKRAASEDVSDHIYLAVRVVLEWLGDDEDGGGGEKIGDFADFWRMFPDCFTPKDEQKN